MTTKSGLKALAAVCLGMSLSSASLAGSAVPDVLEMPAMPTERAARHLLLDVVRADSRLIAVGERGHIIYSDDEGVTWTQASVPVSTTLTAVHFPTPQKGWAVGHSGVLLHSADAGATWEKRMDGNQVNQVVVKSLEQQIADLEAAVDSAPVDKQAQIQTRMDDMQYVLEDARMDAESGPVKPFLDVWFRDENLGLVIGAYGLIFRTTDGGKTWDNIASNIPNPDRFHLNAINQVAGGTLFIVGEAGIIFRSTDAGQTWEKVESPYEGSFFGVTGTGNVNEVLVFGLRGNIFRSTDLGRSWETPSSDGENTLNSALVGTGGRITLVGNDGSVVISTNGGESFEIKIRPDREGITSVAPLKDNNLLLVGDQGVARVNPNGKNL